MRKLKEKERWWFSFRCCFGWFFFGSFGVFCLGNPHACNWVSGSFFFYNFILTSKWRRIQYFLLSEVFKRREGGECFVVYEGFVVYIVFILSFWSHIYRRAIFIFVLKEFNNSHYEGLGSKHVSDGLVLTLQIATLDKNIFCLLQLCGGGLDGNVSFSCNNSLAH